MGNESGKLFCSESGVCPKATVHHGVENELLDEAAACDSAGAVFSETIEELNEVDRLLLLFSASRNLAGVRWLVRLGANLEACDTNGTTCLHTACRSGSAAIVTELLAQRQLSIDACDAAGWTALHVALFMGRRQISVMLMQRGANPTISNGRGQKPAELSSDVWLRETIGSYIEHWERKGRYGWRPPTSQPDDVEVSSKLRFEPFFVPRTAIMKEGEDSHGPRRSKNGAAATANYASLQKLSEVIFNQRPGQGLAFIVATGGIRDFPVELSSFLGQQGISPAQVGQFLGEDFALSQTLRLEFINSVRLIGTGVVSCLAKVFKTIVIPTEMVKIDRLVDGIAQIWWRQHEQLIKKEQEEPRQVEEPEVHGLELMRCLGNYDVLHQLMFATILLHWNLYAPLPPSQRVSAEEWLEISSGILSEEQEKVDLKNVQLLIYKVTSHNFFPQLEIWKVRSPSPIQALPPQASAWARIVVGFPSLALAGAHQVANYRHLRSMLCEGTGPGTACLASPSPSREGPTHMPAPIRARAPPLHMGFGDDPDDNLYGFQESPGPVGGRVWLALHGPLLFLSAGPEPWAPYAFMRVADMAARTEPTSMLLTLQPSAGNAAKLAIQVVFLLPDGRWQVLEVPRFQVQLSDQKKLEAFGVALAEHCSDEGHVSDWNLSSPVSGRVSGSE